MEPLTVSSKGQICIPKALRERLNLGRGARLSVQVDRDRIILSKPADWRSLRGIAAGARGIAAGPDLLASHRDDKRWERRHDRVRP